MYLKFHDPLTTVNQFILLGKGERSSSRNRDRRGDKRGRSPDRRRSPIERRRRRSGSYHSRQSRSYSRYDTSLNRTKLHVASFEVFMLLSFLEMLPVNNTKNSFNYGGLFTTTEGFLTKVLIPNLLGNSSGRLFDFDLCSFYLHLF